MYSSKNEEISTSYFSASKEYCVEKTETGYRQIV